MRVKLLRAWGNFREGRELTIADLEGARLIKGGVATQVDKTSHTPAGPKSIDAGDQVSEPKKPASKSGRRSKATQAPANDAPDVATGETE